MSENITYTPLRIDENAYKNFSLRQNGPNSWVRSVVKCDHQSMSSSYSVINGNSCFIFGTNNLIIGSNNIVSGQANLVIGENNTFVGTDFYPEDSAANIYYKMDPEMVAEKIKLSQLYDTDSDDDDDDLEPAIEKTIRSYLNSHLTKLMEQQNLPRVTTRRAAQRDEPYHVRPAPPHSTTAKLNAVVQLIGKWFSTYLAISSDAIKPGHFRMQKWFLEHLGTRFSAGSANRGTFIPRLEPIIRIIPLNLGSSSSRSESQQPQQVLGDLLFLSMLEGLMNQERSEPSSPAPPSPSVLPEKILNEPDATDAEAKCILCCKRSVKTVVIPCGHSYSCIDCCHNPNLKQNCAVCNKPFSNIIRLFSSGDSS